MISTHSSPSRTLKRPYELSQCPSGTLALPNVLFPELQKINDTVRCAAQDPENFLEQLKQTLNLHTCVLFKNILVFVVPKLGAGPP